MTLTHTSCVHIGRSQVTEGHFKSRPTPHHISDIFTNEFSRTSFILSILSRNHQPCPHFSAPALRARLPPAHPFSSLLPQLAATSTRFTPSTRPRPRPSSTRKSPSRSTPVPLPVFGTRSLCSLLSLFALRLSTAHTVWRRSTFTISSTTPSTMTRTRPLTSLSTRTFVTRSMLRSIFDTEIFKNVKLIYFLQFLLGRW